MKFTYFLKDKSSKSMFLYNTKEHEVLDIIKRLPNKKSSGFDNLPTFCFKVIE